LAVILLCLMPEAMMMPDEITYKATIGACGKGGQGKGKGGAERVYLQRHHQCLQKGWPEHLALNLLNLMPEPRVTPTEIKYNAAIKLATWLDKWCCLLLVFTFFFFKFDMLSLSKGSQPQLALKLLNMMP
jgi:hypothetical protein